MLTQNTLTSPTIGYGFLRTGLFIGIAGGLAEIIFVSLFSGLTGGDASVVARHVASAIGLHDGSAAVGVSIHMGLAVALGIALSAALQIVLDRHASDVAIFSFMLISLAVIWVINYFVVLPLVSPSFVHLLPYAVTLASKLAFGFAAAAMLRRISGATPCRTNC